jgi:hypothetical protein
MLDLTTIQTAAAKGLVVGAFKWVKPDGSVTSGLSERQVCLMEYSEALSNRLMGSPNTRSSYGRID